MDMGADAFDPGAGDEMMPAARLRVGLGELDALPAFQLVDDTDMLAVGADHFHVLPDLPAAGHGRLHRCAVRTGPSQGSSCDRLTIRRLSYSYSPPAKRLES